MALSKNRIKYIRSLELKKNRKADKVFLAEGPKLVGDLLGHFRCRFLIATAEWLSAHRHLAVEDVTEVSEEELSRASLLKTPQQVLAVFEQPDESVDVSVISRSLCLALDGAGPRQFGNNHPPCRLVWNRTYLLFAQHGGCLQS